MTEFRCLLPCTIVKCALKQQMLAKTEDHFELHDATGKYCNLLLNHRVAMAEFKQQVQQNFQIYLFIDIETLINLQNEKHDSLISFTHLNIKISMENITVVVKRQPLALCIANAKPTNSIM
ncbi:hypothetical protein T4D_9953 [Trichinella pseudospiralis]|uniref:Uncharacterized protein n=1 Tax=Trichinella pseudospiralis TaxID=6337 RepID=A0A0V1F928_TRIPS|nr:hypothetical protein T4D_9953 [Trichinella pseudospiralis]